MGIEFNCPSCGAAIEAPDSAFGKKSKCPECSAPLVVPNPSAKSASKAAPRQSEADEYEDVPRDTPASRRGSRDDRRGTVVERPSRGKGRRPDEEFADEPRGRSARRRPDGIPSPGGRKTVRAPAEGGSNMMLIGGGAIGVVALAVVLIFLLRGGDENNGENGVTPTPSGVEASVEPTPTPTPALQVNDAEVFAALQEIAKIHRADWEKAMNKRASRLFKGGMGSIRVFVAKGIMNANDSIRLISDSLLCAISGGDSQSADLYAETPAEIERGQKYWTDWWESVKDKPLVEVIRPAISSDKPVASRELVALALGYIKDKDIVPFIFDLMGDPELSVRRAAYESMDRLLKNDRIPYDPEASLARSAEKIKEFRDWWEGIKATFDFANPTKSLEGLAPAPTAKPAEETPKPEENPE